MSKARTAAFNAVRFAVRLQILAKRLRTQKETLFEPDLEAALLDAENDEAIGSVRGSSPTFNLTSPGLGMPFERQSVPRSEMREGINCARVSLLAEAADKIPRNVFLSDLSAIGTLIYASWASVLLVCCPLGIIAALCGWGATPTFFLNFLILIPLAMTLGDVTEDLALRMGDVAGGLLNASFGNVTELVLGVAALRNGLLEVVADSLLGSILSNMLLVLGCCFLVGGLIHHQQTFNATSNRTCGSLLFLSSIGIAIPTAAASMIDHPTRPDWILQISRGTAVVLLLCYVAYLIFQLGTHKHLFDESEEELHGTSDDEEPELPVISAVGGVCAMGVISVLVAVHSEFLTRSIEKTATETGISMSFLAVIVLPIAGNACEHITAVMVAARNKMDLSLGIALGSSLQIALFAIPFMVIVGWAIGQPMSLDYDYFSVLALVLSVIQANFVNADATSHWLMGVQLCAVYFLIALVFWFR